MNSIRRVWSPRGAVASAGFLAVLIALALAAAAGSASAAKAPFKVLFLNALSGPLSTSGKLKEKAYTAAVNKINAEGGILGSKVELTSLDDTGTGAKTVALAQQETAKAKFNAITCGSFSDEVLACAPVLKSNPALQLPMDASKELDNKKQYPRLFVQGPFNTSASAMAAYLKRKRITSVGHIGGDNATGRTAYEAMAAEFKKAKIKIVKSVFVPVTVTDATPYVQQLQAASPKAVVMTGFTAANIPIMRARAKLGWDVHVYTDWLVASAPLSALTPAERKGITLQVWPFMVDRARVHDTKEFKAFRSEFNKLQGPTVPTAITSSVFAWNTMMAIRAAAVKAKSTDGRKMTKGLERIGLAKQIKGFAGIPKLVMYSPKRHAWGGSPKAWTYINAGPTTPEGYIDPDE
jgi:branched-chain amino acid transport system substrate-binding protein